MRIISRYLLRQHLGPLAFALTALTSLLLLNQVAKQFINLVGKGLPAQVIAEVFVLSIPFIVAVTLPMAVLVAVLYTFSRLAADNEITTMTASGISAGRLLAPVLAGAAVVSLLAFLWSDQVLPRSNHRLRGLLVDIQRTKPSFTLREQVINEVMPGRFFLRAARIDQNESRLKDVSIYDLEDPDRRRVIRADSGLMAYTPSGADLYLTLFDGDIQEVRRAEPAQFSRTFYRTNLIRVAGVGNAFEQTASDDYRGDREMSICQMEKVVREARADLAAVRATSRAGVEAELRRLAGLAVQPVSPARDSVAPPGPSPYCAALARFAGWLLPDSAQASPPVGASPTVPLPLKGEGVRMVVPPQSAQDAPKVTPVRPPPEPRVAPPRSVSPAVVGARATQAPEDGRVEAARRRAATYLVEIHKKLAIAAACLVFALVGVPVALRFPRGGVGLVIGVSLTVFTIYYIGLIGGEELGDRLIVSPFLAMWTPNLIFGALALGGLWALRRRGASARGGDWGELLHRARRLVRAVT